MVYERVNQLKEYIMNTVKEEITGQMNGLDNQINMIHGDAWIGSAADGFLEHWTSTSKPIFNHLFEDLDNLVQYIQNEMQQISGADQVG
jgi:uncharacterized protein YukE